MIVRLLTISALFSTAVYAGGWMDEGAASAKLYAGAPIEIATDSPEWCSGTLSRTTQGSDDPQDVYNTCIQELELLVDYIISDLGMALVGSAEYSKKDASDLAPIQNRIRELEKSCSRGAGNSRGIEESGRMPTPSHGGSIPNQPEGTDDTDEPTVVIHVKARSSDLQQENRNVTGRRIKVFVAPTVDVALPGEGAEKPQTDHDQEPIQEITDSNGQAILKVPGTHIGLESTPDSAETPVLEVQTETTVQGSINAELENSDTQSVVDALPKELRRLLTDINVINGSGFLTFTFPASMHSSVRKVLARIPGVVHIRTNFCREKQLTANDPLFLGNEAWGQRYDNQWAIKRVGLSNNEKSAWNLLGNNPKPVTVAVIDTGLDWNHLDIDWKNIWRNPGEEPDNQIDDDNNGYVDDIIGWDFLSNHNKPWDHDGHGTLVAGVIAATGDNDIGIAGINPHARIMVLKALNDFGHTRASTLAKAIVYAVDNGAHVINISSGGREISTIEKRAVQYAIEKEVLVVVSAGNEGINVGGFGIAGLEGVLTVSATNQEDDWQAFSNWGPQVNIAAPGLEVLSLRARRTDSMRDIAGMEYLNGASYVGQDMRYYRAGGTSISAAIVTGVASLLYSRNPSLMVDRVRTILETTAEDIELTGFDTYTGYGIVNATAALETDVEFFLKARIRSVAVVQTEKGTALQVHGTALANDLSGYRINLGAGEYPDSWETLVTSRDPVKEGVLGAIDAEHFEGAFIWILRLTVVHKNGVEEEHTYRLETEEIIPQ